MQLDFHYYATYCASFLAGFSHEDSLDIAYSCQFVDCCTRSYLSKIKGPQKAATTQTQSELANVRMDIVGLQDITRIWSSFHFLPYDLYAKVKGIKDYKNKFRLLCFPNGALVSDTVQLAKGNGTQAYGIAMHVLADTWAHSGFCGTPSLVINNTNSYFFEILPDGTNRRISFKNSLSVPDDPDSGTYTGSLYQPFETSIMNLGHGRAGHLPDYSYARYEYLPSWGNYETRFKDNPSDYRHAFAQMIESLRYLGGFAQEFKLDTYAFDLLSLYEKDLSEIIDTRRTDASDAWKAFGEKLSGCEIPDFDLDKYTQEYISSSNKSLTFMGRFISAALAQKGMVTNRIFTSKNLLAGISVERRKA